MACNSAPFLGQAKPGMETEHSPAKELDAAMATCTSER